MTQRNSIWSDVWALAGIALGFGLLDSQMIVNECDHDDMQCCDSNNMIETENDELLDFL